MGAGQRARAMPEILIVEDEFLVALDLEDIVSRAGYRVLGIVADRKDFERVEFGHQDRQPHVALVDLNLRDGPTGPEIARRLSDRFGTIIIFVTANPDQIADPPCTALGYIRKPFAPDAIVAALGHAVNEARVSSVPGLHRFG